MEAGTQVAALAAGLAALAAARARRRGRSLESALEPDEKDQPAAETSATKKTKKKQPAAAAAAGSQAEPARESRSSSITCVVQRCEEARLLIDDEARTVEVKRGLVVYLSFGENATLPAARRLARLLVSLNLSTTGRWGDGTKAKSVGGIVASGARQEILVVPQACLTSKVKGKQLRYAAQLSRADGFALYCAFLAETEQALLDFLLAQAFQNDRVLNSLCERFALPTGTLRGPFCAFDKRGVPTTRETDGTQVPLEKADRKAADKIYRTLQTKIAAYAESARLSWSALQQDQRAPSADLVPGLFKLVVGTFGNRQGLYLDAACGPSTHILTA